MRTSIDNAENVVDGDCGGVSSFGGMWIPSCGISNTNSTLSTQLGIKIYYILSQLSPQSPQLLLCLIRLEPVSLYPWDY